MAFTTELGIKDTYLYYENYCEERGMKTLKYKQVTQIIKDFNILLRDYILDNNIVKLPYSIGFITVLKFPNKFEEDKKHKWKVDFKKSKELGFKVYYGDEYGYRWKWYKTILKNSGNTNYKYVPCRYCSRAIAKVIQQGKDFCMEGDYQLREYKELKTTKALMRIKE